MRARASFLPFRCLVRTLSLAVDLALVECNELPFVFSISNEDGLARKRPDDYG